MPKKQKSSQNNVLYTQCIQACEVWMFSWTQTTSCFLLCVFQKICYLDKCTGHCHTVFLAAAVKSLLCEALKKVLADICFLAFSLAFSPPCHLLIEFCIFSCVLPQLESSSCSLWIDYSQVCCKDSKLKNGVMTIRIFVFIFVILKIIV